MISYDELQVCMIKAERLFSQLIGEKLSEVSSIPKEHLQQTALSKRQDILLKLGKFFEKDSDVSLWAKSDMFLEGIHSWVEHKAVQYKGVDCKKPTAEEQVAINHLTLHHQERMARLESKKSGFWDGHGIAASMQDLSNHLEKEKLTQKYNEEMARMPQSRDQEKLSALWDTVFNEVMVFTLNHEKDLLKAMETLIQQKNQNTLNLNNAYVGLTGNIGNLRGKGDDRNLRPRTTQDLNEKEIVGEDQAISGATGGLKSTALSHELFHHIDIPEQLKERREQEMKKHLEVIQLERPKNK